MKSYPSTINGKLEVIKGKGGFIVTSGGFLQSGPFIEALWQEAFDKLLKTTPLKKILVLGFGAGSVMKAVNEHSPRSKVTAVEIDPVMVRIAKEYFPKNCKGVKLTCIDALEYLDSLPPSTTFDLTVVDCYIGGKEPDEVKAVQFFDSLKKISRNVLYNQIFTGKDPKEMERLNFLRPLDKLYPSKALKLPNNIIIAF